ncbi:helix-turn-helix domain-containing protein [Actinosynnema mirum]|uniref:Transcriptional regulator, XRE family n=1 Tax=Actinosynnema mirum (strain ATCC 29888 / DSM 43827 / JCM 3225 / NBRC 14064 / NCIMB 13271 / NRRL B-12336 / IMRU 3971 / 101) TaxID=446462 RepID=C6WQK4_ACTMD|nr:helix-turn-helix transcriptional regulator [Actinosynnema mirum]ACU38694.1 transcriptional regulator, XRE family [Actinosynnema mirum DSM 43827]
MMNEDNDFKKIFQRMLENRNFSPGIFSKLTGLSQSTINQLLNGTLKPNYNTMQAVASALQIETADLMAIAGLPPVKDTPAEHKNSHSRELGALIAVGTFLNAEQLKSITKEAARYKQENLSKKT